MVLKIELEVSVKVVAFSSKGKVGIAKSIFDLEVLGLKLLCCCQKAIDVLTQAHLQRSANPCRNIRCKHRVRDSYKPSDPFEFLEFRVVCHHGLNFLQQPLLEARDHTSTAGKDQVLDNTTSVFMIQLREIN